MLALATAVVVLGAGPAGPTPALGAAPPPQFFGVTPATKLSEQEYRMMSAGGLKTLRVPFFWEDIQPLSRHVFDWRRPDRIVERAAVNGIQVQPFVMGVPRWLRRSDGGAYPPLDRRGRQSWAAFLGALADRYGSEGSFWTTFGALNPDVPPRPITAWQIWNEPSDTSYWKPLATAPERYAELLALSDRTLADRDPAASVIAAGLFRRPQGGIPMKPFLTRFYAAGARSSFDALAIHPYSPSVKGVLRQIRAARRLMRRNSDAAKPLWITELGWPTLHEVESGAFVKTERGQRRMLTRSYSAILESRRRWRVERLVWYTWRDNTLFPTCNLCRSSGLFREDLSPKPAWEALVGFTGGSATIP